MITGMKYIGKDSNIPNRVTHHLNLKAWYCPEIHKSIKKYGKRVFNVEIIEYKGASVEALRSIENWYIKRYRTLYPNGYNVRIGGGGHKLSKEKDSNVIENIRKGTDKRFKKLREDKKKNAYVIAYYNYHAYLHKRYLDSLLPHQLELDLDPQ